MNKEQQKKYLNNLPIYDAFIDTDDLESGIKFISLVADPAIEIKGFCFANTNPRLFKLAVNKEKQIVAGPAMIPGKLILREDENGNFFYIRFSREEVKKIFDKFNKNNNSRSINLDHTDRMVPGYIEQFWYVADPIYDKSKIYGFNLPIGTPFYEVKIEDQKFWESEVKELQQCGFSIQGDFFQSLANFNEISIVDIVDILDDDEIMDIANCLN